MQTPTKITLPLKLWCDGLPSMPSPLAPLAPLAGRAREIFNQSAQACTAFGLVRLGGEMATGFFNRHLSPQTPCRAPELAANARTCNRSQRVRRVPRTVSAAPPQLTSSAPRYVPFFSSHAPEHRWPLGSSVPVSQDAAARPPPPPCPS